MNLTLTEQELAGILQEISESSDPAADATVSIFRILLAAEGKGWDDFSVENKLDPTDYCIPEDQWGVISLALAARGNEHNTVSYVLDWVNRGPSSFKEKRDV